MTIDINKWLRIYYNRIVHSIAFYPAMIAIAFLLLSWTMIQFDFSDWGKEWKSEFSWMSLKDANTARSIIATIAGAIISLTVFSFSMVMIVLNQAASQMSNRVLSSMIDNRFQQIVLGFYIGTVVYALFLLSTIREISSGIYVPALSIYLLIVLTVIDIFLFIYFLEYVTQTVKYETIINRVKEKSLETIAKRFESASSQMAEWTNQSHQEILVKKANYFQSFDAQKLLKIAESHDLYLSFAYEQSTFLLQNTVLLKVYKDGTLDQKILEEMAQAVDFFSGQPIETNADYGFRQLTEIAIKALSPGINDPGTAVMALNALANLFASRLYKQVPQLRKDSANVARLFVPTSTFEALFERSISPIWNYGKDDLDIQTGLLQILHQLKAADHKGEHTILFDKFIAAIAKCN